MRFRNVFIGIGSILIIAILLLTDPDSGLIQNLPFGASSLSILIILATSILYIGVLHFGRRALIDYVRLMEFFTTAARTPEGAGLAIVGVGLMMISVAIVISAATT